MRACDLVAERQCGARVAGMLPASWEGRGRRAQTLVLGWGSHFGNTRLGCGWLFEKEFQSGNLWEISGDLAHSNRALTCGCSSLPTHGVS